MLVDNTHTGAVHQHPYKIHTARDVESGLLHAPRECNLLRETHSRQALSDSCDRPFSDRRIHMGTTVFLIKFLKYFLELIKHFKHTQNTAN